MPEMSHNAPKIPQTRHKHSYDVPPSPSTNYPRPFVPYWHGSREMFRGTIQKREKPHFKNIEI